MQRMLLPAESTGSLPARGQFAKLLYTRPRASPERTLVMRALMVLALFGSVIAVFWFDRDSLRDNVDNHMSFADVVYFTFVTVTTVGYGDIVPVAEHARLIDALFVTPVRIFVWFIFLGTAYEFVIQRILEDYRMNAMRDSLQDHVIVCGFGYSGSVAAREVVAQGHPPGAIVVIDTRPERLEEAAEEGYIGLRGDATRDAVLIAARARTARAVLVCVSRDDTTVLTVLTARSMNERARIIATVRDEENLKLVRKAGADQVVSPAKIAGFLVADAVGSRYTTRFITDILTSRGGELRIVERQALAEEVGRPIRDVPGRLVVALERGGKVLGFWDSPDERVQAGDLVFAIEGKSAER